MTTIKHYRKKLGITQAELADSLGVTQGAITNWEKGIRKPDIYMLKRIADVLRCTIDDLLANDDQNDIQSNVND